MERNSQDTLVFMDDAQLLPRTGRGTVGPNPALSRKVFIALLSLSCLVTSVQGEAPAAKAAPVRLGEYFGFLPVEIVKLNARSANLLSADMNGDGREDLLLSDDSHSRLDLLLQRKEPLSWESVATEETPNALPKGGRYDPRRIPVDRAVIALGIGDLNHDGMKDIVFLGSPDRLTYLLQGPKNTWKPSRVQRIPEIQAAPWMLAVGDINHDQRDDVVILGRRETYLFLQDKSGEIPTPVKLLNTSDKLGLLTIADLDGDQRNDLCYMASDEAERSLCARFQSSTGELGPEFRFDLDRPRAVAIKEMDGAPGAEILAIHSQTGRVTLSKLSRPEPLPGELGSQLVQYGLQPSTSKEQGLALGDLDGDGLQEIVGTNPESAQVVLWRQQPQVGPAAAATFPTFQGITQVHILPSNRPGKGGVFSLSRKEKAIGISYLDSGRLTFPQTLPIEGQPLWMWPGNDSPAEGRLLYLAGKSPGRKDEPDYALRGLTVTPTGEWKPLSWQSKSHVAIPLTDPPERGGIFRTGGKTYLLIWQKEDRTPFFAELTEQGLQTLTVAESRGISPVNNAGPWQGKLGPTDLLMSIQPQFVRSVRLNAQRRWEVLDQYDAAESKSQLAGAATLDLDGTPGEEIVLVDPGTRKLRILKQEGTLFRNWREVELGGFPFLSLQTADVNGDHKPDLVLLGKGKFAVLYAAHTDPRLKELAAYETALERAHLQDLTGGDLNRDGKADLALIDSKQHQVEIVSYFPGIGIKPALTFKVFESKHLTENEKGGIEPRECLIQDVTGDQRLDLILLTHDRLLIYPQDPGASEQAPSR